MSKFKRRKYKVKFYKNKRILMYSLLGLFLFLGMGYSVLNTDLNIFGSIRVKEYVAPTLYNALKKEAENNGLAKEYTGSHGDSMDSSKSTEKIYHWYAENNTEGTQILDKNNVIFAGQCFQMIRTTDTGGVKMIYNGEAENNQCLNTRGNHVGYASRTSQSLNGNYWYGTDYTYDKTNNVFSIAGTTEQATWSEANAPGLIGKYTCKQTTETGTCATLYLVESYNNTTSAYVIPLNANSHYSQFGKLQFNADSSSPADVGYMYNTRYTYNEKSFKLTETMLSSSSINENYWYADTITWGNPVSNHYNLDNPYQVSSTDDYPSLVGKYTFTNPLSKTYTSPFVYYIVAVNNSTIYYTILGDTGNHTLSDFNYTYTYGDSYTDNGNGTYTIKNQDESNPLTIERKNWYTSYSNIGAGKYVCKNAVNDTCSELWYTTQTTNTNMTYIKVANYKYAKSFEYKQDPDDGTYKYFLDDDTSTTFWNINDSANRTSINNAHYTCWNEDGKCTTISYIYFNSGSLYYIKIMNGKSIDDAKNEMLYNNDVNQKNSTIKSGVDAWYKHYLLNDYDDYIEDTVFCNDRSIKLSGGWNPDGGRLVDAMYFKYLSYISCTNETDKFSISNNKAQLTYKVGLMSSTEMNILNNYNVRKTGQTYWLGSPDNYFKNYANGIHVMSTGHIEVNNDNVSYLYGVRPSISLIPGIEYSSGDGSMANPYIVKMN